MSLRGFRGGVLPFLPMLILTAVFLPLPLVVLPVLFLISFVLQPRAAPCTCPAAAATFAGPSSLRSPPA